MAGYGIRAFLVAQSLHQIDRAYGYNHAILDNCHVRVAFAPNDERTAKRLSDALGTATQLRAQRNLSGKRLSAWLAHTTISEQETPRPLLTPGEVLQLAPDEALVLVSGAPPIRARKLKYFADRNFSSRRLPAPQLSDEAHADRPPARRDDWSGQIRGPDARLDRGELGTAENADEGAPPIARSLARRRREKERTERPLADLPLFAAAQSERHVEGGTPIGSNDLDETIQFPGARL